MSNIGWRGVENVFCVGHGEWSDPDLCWSCNGELYVFNYWDIESGLWEMFLEDTGHTDNQSGDPHVEIEFDLYCQRNCISYMQDVIYGNYFPGESNDWHDYYNGKVV